MPGPDENADEDAVVALSVLEGQTTAADAARAGECPGLVAQLESVQQIMAALKSIDAGSNPLSPPPFPTWGPFVLNEQIGRGTFGVVYRGFDPAVAREIAVKLYEGPDLPSEPRLMARVRHPNVVTVFGAAVYEGRPGIWMELVRGRTLAERVRAEGPLAIGEVIQFGIELCQALQAVHDEHLIHKDVKAGNVIEKDDGGVVLMDFGAGAARRTNDDEPMRITGTPLYMAPEVALGQAASTQSDIYSLGVLLYHLLTRAYPVTVSTWKELQERYERQPHAGDQELTTQLQKLRPDVSRALARCIGKALAPVERRYRDARDFRRGLSRLHRHQARWLSTELLRHPGVHVLSAFLACLLGIGVGFRTATSGRATRIPNLQRLTWDDGLTTDATRSSDGKLLAYASDRSGDGNLDIWLQQVPGGTPLRLTKDPADESEPSLSPDGRHVAFRSERDGGGIYIAETFGGRARLLAENGRWPRFSPDGRRLSYVAGKRFGTISVVPVTGGAVVEPARSVVARSAGIWSPDGKYLLVVASAKLSDLDWWVIPSQPDRATPPVRTNAFPHLQRHGISIALWPTPWDWTSNRVLFHARVDGVTNLWEIPLSASFQVAAAPLRLSVSTEEHAQPSLGTDRSIVFSTRTHVPYLWELKVNANRGHADAGPRLLMPHYPGRGAHSLSSDGRRMAFIARSHGSTIALKDLESGAETTLNTANPSVEQFPCISNDGTSVVYSAIEDGRLMIRRASVDGGIPGTICEDCGPPLDWSADLRYATLQKGLLQRPSLGLLEIASAKQVPLLQTPHAELYRGTFSSDGRWIAFHAALVDGSFREYVAPFRGMKTIDPQQWIAVTDGKTWTDAPRWSPNGNLLYYVSEADGYRCIWAQPLDPSTKRPTGDALAVHHVHGRKHSISNVDITSIELSVARDRLVFNMGEARGNIWLARFE